MKTHRPGRRLFSAIFSLTSGIGFAAMILCGVGLIIAGIPLLAFLVGFLMIPAGCLLTVLGIIGLVRR